MMFDDTIGISLLPWALRRLSAQDIRTLFCEGRGWTLEGKILLLGQACSHLHVNYSVTRWILWRNARTHHRHSTQAIVA